MTLTDLLWASQNQIYKQTHTYGMPAKLFDKVLSRVKVIEYKSKAHIRVVLASLFETEQLETSSYEVVSTGVWVCIVEDEGYTFFNYTTQFQAVMATQKNKEAFVVQPTLLQPKTLKFDYVVELRKVAKEIELEFLSRYTETEGHLRSRDVYYVVNDYLRQQTTYSAKTRLVSEQPQTYVHIIGLIEEYDERGKLKPFAVYLRTRGKPYGKYKNR